MKKFHDLYKEKLAESETQQESKVLTEFRNIYSVLLEHYGVATIHELDEETQLSFLTELNHYWSEDQGLSEKGEKFIAKRSMSLNENSTSQQKKNFLKAKVSAVIDETVRQSELKWKIYDIVDEMYKETKAAGLREILTADTITNLILESFTKTVEDFTANINKELSESSKPEKKYVIKVKAR